MLFRERSTFQRFVVNKTLAVLQCMCVSVCARKQKNQHLQIEFVCASPFWHDALFSFHVFFSARLCYSFCCCRFQSKFLRAIISTQCFLLCASIAHSKPQDVKSNGEVCSKHFSKLIDVLFFIFVVFLSFHRSHTNEQPNEKACTIINFCLFELQGKDKTFVSKRFITKEFTTEKSHISEDKYNRTRSEWKRTKELSDRDRRKSKEVLWL